jgi:hypothetical protein
MAAVPLLPPALAVMVAGPTETPVTRPDVETDAIPVALDDHVTGSESALPDASRGVADSCVVCPTATFADGGVTLTLATAGGLWSPPPLHEPSTNTARTVPARRGYMEPLRRKIDREL